MTQFLYFILQTNGDLLHMVASKSKAYMQHLNINERKVAQQQSRVAHLQTFDNHNSDLQDSCALFPMFQ
jgi:hypothetical protein